MLCCHKSLGSLYLDIGANNVALHHQSIAISIQKRHVKNARSSTDDNTVDVRRRCEDSEDGTHSDGSRSLNQMGMTKKQRKKTGRAVVDGDSLSLCRMCLQMGKLQLEAEMPAEACETFETAIDAINTIPQNDLSPYDTSLIDAYEGLADAYVLLAEHLKALDAYEKAASLLELKLNVHGNTGGSSCKTRLAKLLTKMAEISDQASPGQTHLYPSRHRLGARDHRLGARD